MLNVDGTLTMVIVNDAEKKINDGGRWRLGNLIEIILWDKFREMFVQHVLYYTKYTSIYIYTTPITATCIVKCSFGKLLNFQFWLLND